VGARPHSVTQIARRKFHVVDANHSRLLNTTCLPERLVHLLRTSGMHTLKRSAGGRDHGHGHGS
jgi:hypothetical protein